MIIAISFTTLVGVLQSWEMFAVGRIEEALGWFFTAPLISLLLGMFFVNVLLRRT
jgi:hypothetical protein